MSDADQRRKYADAIAAQLAKWDVAQIQGWIDAWSQQIAGDVAADPHTLGDGRQLQHGGRVGARRSFESRADYLRTFVDCEQTERRRHGRRRRALVRRLPRRRRRRSTSARPRSAATASTTTATAPSTKAASKGGRAGRAPASASERYGQLFAAPSVAAGRRTVRCRSGIGRASPAQPCPR